MYNNSSSQYPASGYPASYQQYSGNYGTAGYNYQDYGQYTGNQQQQIQQSTTAQWTPTSYGPTQIDAVAQEMQQQKAQLIKQREDYVKKVSVLRRELDQLRLQKQELVGDGHHSSNILRENDKLQDEIQGKMKAIQNVIDMLSSIIKDGKSISDLEAMLSPSNGEKHKSPVTHVETNHKHHKKEIAPDPNNFESYNYVHYDTGLHWCRMCDEFPETAKDYLLHLQDKSHRQLTKENDVDNTPWHKLPAEPVLPSDENAPTKRVPIKGLQFFISAPSWYCKLCDIWIGDLHCASHHLKSRAHFQNYENFVSQNPHWEMEWLKDRENAMGRKGDNSSDSDEPEKKKKRRKDKKHSFDVVSAKNKKSKKRSKKHRRKSSDSSSSSSSSDSSSDDEKADRSKSIRVAMRNMKQVHSIMEEDLSGKWSVLEKLVEEHKKKQEIEKQEKQEKIEKQEKQEKEAEPEDKLINQWMTVTSTQDKDRQLLESLKDRMRQKQEQERIKQAELEKKKKEKEKLELERMQLKLKQEKEAAEEAERERKRKEQEEYERIRDKERNQVRFKANTNYRRRRSDSRSDDEDKSKHKYREDRSSKERHRSRSPSADRKSEESNEKKKPPGPPSYKKLPFIGRMPLFKNKKTVTEEREEKKREIQKESYDQPRRTRFEPGNLPRAFMPRPDVVCFPKLSCIPPLTMPPPPTVSQKVEPPEPPKISAPKKERAVVEEEPQAPPPPKLDTKEDKSMNLSDDEVLYANPGEGMDPSMMGQYYQDYQNMMYSSQDMYSYDSNDVSTNVPHSHTMPLEPPPLPPDDDLALLGICADDMAAQSF